MANKQTNATQIRWRIGSLFLILCLGSIISTPHPEIIKKTFNLKTQQETEDLEQQLVATENKIQLSWKEKHKLLANFKEQVGAQK